MRVDRPLMKSKSAVIYLDAAANICADYSDIKFGFYSSDAIDVAEQPEHGTLDFAVCLEPVDTARYDYISLPDSSK